jgi:hypothetical protein
MKEKKYIESLIKKLQTGDLSDEELSQLKDLTTKYPEFDGFVDLHQKLVNTQNAIKQPKEEAFSRMRSSVMKTVRIKSMRTQSHPISDRLEKLKNFLLRPEMAVAALTLIIGFLLGRFTPQPDSSTSQNVLSQIYTLATENKRLVDVQNSPYYYSNVSFEEMTNDKIALSFDVSTHMDIVRPKNDALVREVIAQTLLNPTNPGSELKAIAYSSSILDRKIKEALIFSTQNAPILAVRIKAMAGLMQYEDDIDVQRAFLDIFADEESVKMRLMALDYLKKSRIDKEKLQLVLEKIDSGKNAAVIIKAQKYLDNNGEDQ